MTEILPVAMFTYVVNYTDPTIAALSTLFIVATFLVVWLADRYLGLGRRVPPALTSHGRPVVELLGCTRDYGGVRAVDALDLVVFEGEFLSLLGPSGCGKTTTLNLIAGFVEPTAGRILIDGEDVTGRPAHLRGLGVVFQSYALFPHLSVFENVAFGLRERRDARGRDRAPGGRGAGAGAPGPARAAAARPSSRAACSSAWPWPGRSCTAPRVLLLDEPLAALDKKLREEMRDELRAIQRSVGITTIFVTHDQAEALGLSDRIAVMSRRAHRAARRAARDLRAAGDPLRGRVHRRLHGAARPRRRARTRWRSLAARRSGCWAARRSGRATRSSWPSGRSGCGWPGGPGENVVDGRVEGLVYQGALTEVTARSGTASVSSCSCAEPAPVRARAGADRASAPAAGRLHACSGPRAPRWPVRAGADRRGARGGRGRRGRSVPDTWIGRLMAAVRRRRRIRAVDVAREEEAVAVACGANLAGGRGAVLIQNAGLLNCGGVLAGLVELYRSPCFFIVSLRGDHRDPVYYHAPKGRVTEATLARWRLPYAQADRRGDLAAQVRQRRRVRPWSRAGPSCC